MLVAVPAGCGVAADAIVFASHNYRREWYVGASTAIAITGNKIAPGLGDRYLGRQGYDAQQHYGHDDSDRPNNLYVPVDVDEDFGAHGVLDDRASSQSLQLWADQHRDWSALAVLAGGLCDAVTNGAGKFWRGGLLGLGLATLGTIALGKLARRPPAPAGAAADEHRVGLPARRRGRTGRIDVGVFAVRGSVKTKRRDSPNLSPDCSTEHRTPEGNPTRPHLPPPPPESLAAPPLGDGCQDRRRDGPRHRQLRLVHPRPGHRR